MEDDQSKFNLHWSPEAPAGLLFKNVVPDSFGAGYQALPDESEQAELKNKMKSSRLRSRRHSKVFFVCCILQVVVIPSRCCRLFIVSTYASTNRSRFYA